MVQQLEYTAGKRNKSLNMKGSSKASMDKHVHVLDELQMLQKSYKMRDKEHKLMPLSIACMSNLAFDFFSVQKYLWCLLSSSLMLISLNKSNNQAGNSKTCMSGKCFYQMLVYPWPFLIATVAWCYEIKLPEIFLNREKKKEKRKISTDKLDIQPKVGDVYAPQYIVCPASNF